MGSFWLFILIRRYQDMKKKLDKIGYEAELIYDNNWKVNVIYAGRILYFYLFDNEVDAIDKYNEFN
jgi:hypothetical protein